MKRSRINKVSARRKHEYQIYKRLSAEFLERHPYCQHWMAENDVSKDEIVNGFVEKDCKWLEVPKSAEIHHKKGRGKFYLDMSTWMAVRPGHSHYIHEDPLRYEKGYCLPRR